MKIPGIEKSVVRGRDVSSWNGSSLSQNRQCLNEDNTVHVQGTALGSQYLMLLSIYVMVEGEWCFLEEGH